MIADADAVPISALQHWLYCPRQCALIHLEQSWAENRFTAEGRILHERADRGTDESRLGVRIARGLSVNSRRHGLVGKCDVVEFHRDGSVLPVEYKRGRPKAHRADEVQICAQALCLEEMLDLSEGENRVRVLLLREATQTHRGDDRPLASRPHPRHRPRGSPDVVGKPNPGRRLRRAEMRRLFSA